MTTQTTQDDAGSETAELNYGQFKINLEKQKAVRQWKEKEPVDEPEGHQRPENWETVEKSEETEIEDKGTREINQFTKFQGYSRGRSGTLSEEYESKTPILLRKEDGEWEAIDLTELRQKDRRDNQSEYHDLEEDGIRKKVNWSKRGRGRGHESGSGSNYLIYRRAVEDCEEAYLLKHHHESGGSVNGEYRKDDFKIYKLEVAE